MNVFVGCFRVYFWLAAVGFPLITMHWCAYERKMSKRDYQTGWDDGWRACDDEHEEAVKTKKGINP